MRTKTKISLRIDDDLLKVLKNNSTGNLTAYIEDLLLKGLITDLADVNQQIKFGKDFKNFVSAHDKKSAPTNFHGFGG